MTDVRVDISDELDEDIVASVVVVVAIASEEVEDALVVDVVEE